MKSPTLLKYKGILAQMWYPHLGDCNIESIKRSDVNTAIAKVGNWAQRSPKRWNDALIPLRGVFTLAMDDDLIVNDPTAKLRNKRPNPEPVEPFAYAEVLAILQHMQAHYSPQVHNAFAMLFFTGMRVS